MRKVDIRSKCRVNSNCEKDTFVGLRCSDGDISINFPIGYHISEDDNEMLLMKWNFRCSHIYIL